MPYERSLFGDGSAAGSGNVKGTVSNHYGPRDTGKTSGVELTFGGVNELVIDIDGETLAAGDLVLIKPTLFAGSLIKEAYVEVSEAFDTTTLVASVGTDGSEATNGVDVSQAQAAAVGVYDISGSLAGTWAAAGGFTADTTVGLNVAGTVDDATVGKARVVIRYVRV